MIEIDDTTIPGFRYLSGDSDKICRLCFGETENGVYLTESRFLECHYYDHIVTFKDMLIDLGTSIDPSLPQMLCESCADITMNAFLFQKLCHQSQKKWLETIEKFNKTLGLCDTLGPTVKTAYLLIKSEGNAIYISKKYSIEKNKEVALRKLRGLIRSRQNRAKLKKKSIVETKVCEKCGDMFHSKKILIKHIESHNDIKYSCKLCPKLFQNKILLHNHIQNVHKPRTIQCPKCAKMFSTERMPQSHDSSDHTAAICKHCFMQFPSKKDLRKHSIIHEAHKLICPLCNKKFKSKSYHKIHLQRCGNAEHERLEFICDICNKIYSCKGALRAHLRAEHGFGNFYTCNWCSKRFDAVSRLNDHIVKHTRERNFHCDQCAGKFVTYRALLYHTRLHTGEKPYACDMCDESFLSASRRLEHKRRKHLGPNRECTFCHRKFVYRNELQKHLRRHTDPRNKLFVAETDARWRNQVNS